MAILGNKCNKENKTAIALDKQSTGNAERLKCKSYLNNSLYELNSGPKQELWPLKI